MSHWLFIVLKCCNMLGDKTDKQQNNTLLSMKSAVIVTRLLDSLFTKDDIKIKNCG